MSHTIKTNPQFEKEKQRGKLKYVKRRIEEEEAQQEIVSVFYNMMPREKEDKIDSTETI